MKRKKAFLVLFTVLSVSAVSALQFDVQVGSITDSSEYRIQYEENTNIQEINVTVLNSGSIGCQYRLKGEFQYANTTHTRYSDSYSLFPGAESVAKLHFIPENYTGEVRTDLYTEYCDQEKQIAEFNFTSPEKIIPNETVESETLDVTNYSSKARLDVERGRLVPQETPPYWKASSAEISNNTATVRYDAPIFKEGENLTYTVLNNESRVIGETEIYLKESKNIWDKLESNLLFVLLGLSLAANFGLALQKLKNRIK